MFLPTVRPNARVRKSKVRLGERTLAKSGKTTLNPKKLADNSGIAIVIVDKNGDEALANNNNSMCAELYYSEEFGKNCAEYCGKAFERSFEAGKTIEYRCYAGLDCRAVPLKAGRKQLVAIVGRAFTTSETYRAATE